MYFTMCHVTFRISIRRPTGYRKLSVFPALTLAGMLLFVVIARRLHFLGFEEQFFFVEIARLFYSSAFPQSELSELSRTSPKLELPDAR